MKGRFALAIFLSAALLFTVQPMVGQTLLPVLGGSPAVWSSCMLFFQAVLLLGYLYAHALTKRVDGQRQWAAHGAILLAASLVLPLAIEVDAPWPGNPRWWALRTLAAVVGLPFFALAATAPLLQQWFSRTSDPGARDPYFLYAASNAGSLLGLVAYLAIEPLAARKAQALGWSAGFWAVAALVTACGYAARRSPAYAPARARGKATGSLPMSDRAMWVVLALVPSALLLGVTQHLATDVVSAPLVWAVPLALYLLTFVAAFSARGFGTARGWGTVAPVAALLVLVVALAEVRYPIIAVTLAHLAAFTVLAMMCHARLAERRPHAAHLTGYFVCVSLGGVLGGLFATLVAPALFSSVLEYPLAVGAAVLLRPHTVRADITARSPIVRLLWRAAAVALLIAGYWLVSAFDEGTTGREWVSGGLFAWTRALAADAESAERLVRVTFAVPAALLLLRPRAALLFAGLTTGLLAAASTVRTGGEVLVRERTFFGVHQVTSVQDGAWHVLTHGTTTHGLQGMRGKLRSLPTAYYHPSGPIGDVVFTLVPEGRFREVAVVGLGAGALAAYAGNGVRMDFFEIDEAVIRIADDPRYFTYLSDARARPGIAIRMMPVDGRLGLKAAPAGSHDLIVLDAFSSDVIPAHLLTREAVAIYESRLKSRGLLAFHVSSRFFDLPPVIARLAADRGLVAYVRHDEDLPPDKRAEAKRASTWVVVARDQRDLGQLARSAPRWIRLSANAAKPLWTDDYRNVLGALH